MTNLKTRIEEMAKEVLGGNAQYMKHCGQFQNKVGSLEYLEERNMTDRMEEVFTELEAFMKDWETRNITPVNAKVGDGVTMNLYSDAHAGTIIKVTKTTVTVQQDRATLNPDWKPEITPGGFAGHCTNQDSQTYTYERDENGRTVTFRWSSKYDQYRNNPAGMTLTRGRHEFYDYNF